ncbi:hypothetical protein [Thermocatellispora tengchongensis]|uniref:hypothetical protein n=1 Tax=Thermocatellispora tengchongensis TaxID=1073253 RepID=UPI00363420FA
MPGAGPVAAAPGLLLDQTNRSSSTTMGCGAVRSGSGASLDAHGSCGESTTTTASSPSEGRRAGELLTPLAGRDRPLPRPEPLAGRGEPDWTGGLWRPGWTPGWTLGWTPAPGWMVGVNAPRTGSSASGGTSGAAGAAGTGPGTAVETRSRARFCARVSTNSGTPRVSSIPPAKTMISIRILGSGAISACLVAITGVMLIVASGRIEDLRCSSRSRL